MVRYIGGWSFSTWFIARKTFRYKIGPSGGGTSAEFLTFDPMEIRGEESHKVVLQNLVIACLAVCILSTVSYTTVNGTELCQQFMEGRFKE